MSTTLFDIPAASPPARAGGSDVGAAEPAERFPAAAGVLAEVFGRVLAPSPRLSVPEWVHRYRVVSDSGGSRSGPWRHYLTPHAVQVMRNLGGPELGGDPAVREVVLMFPAQWCKTECYINAALARADQAPTPTIWTVPNEEWAAVFTAKRVYPPVRSIPHLVAKLDGPPRLAMKTNLLSFNNGGFIKWATSQSDAPNTGTPAGVRFLDEFDTAGFKPGVLEHVRNRAAAWPGSILGIASTPTYEGAGIDLEFQGTQQRLWHVPCPLCGHYQFLIFARLKWDGGGCASDEEVEATCVYDCERCRQGIRPDWLPWMQARGWWCPEGVTLTGDGRAIADRVVESAPCGGGYLDDLDPAAEALVKPVGTPKRASRRKVGYHGLGLNSLLREGQWRGIVKEFCEKNRDNGAAGPSREWWNLAVGTPHSGVRGDRASTSDLEALCSPPRVHGGYELGELPGGPGVRDGWGYGPPLGTGHLAHFGGPRALVAAVDVQRDRMYLLVRAFGVGGERSWLVWYEEIPSVEGDNLAPLDAVLDYVFEWQSPPSREAVARGGFLGWPGLQISAMAVDSGNRTREVYAWCRKASLAMARRGKRLAGRIFPVKGQDEESGKGGPATSEPFTRRSLDVDAAGKRLTGAVGGLELIGPRVGQWKDAIYGRLVAARTAVAEAGGDVEAAGWYFPEQASMGEDRGKSYLSSLTAEHRVLVETKDRGYRAKTSRWVKRPGIHGLNNHYWDCEVYLACIAEVTGIRYLGRHDGDAGSGAPAGAAGGGMEGVAKSGADGVAAAARRGVLADGGRADAAGYLADVRERLGSVGRGGGGGGA